MKRKFIAIALAVCLIGVTGCSSNQAADTPAKTETVETVSVTEAASERATESEELLPFGFAAFEYIENYRNFASFTTLKVGDSDKISSGDSSTITFTAKNDMGYGTIVLLENAYGEIVNVDVSSENRDVLIECFKVAVGATDMRLDEDELVSDLDINNRELFGIEDTQMVTTDGIIIIFNPGDGGSIMIQRDKDTARDYNYTKIHSNAKSQTEEVVRENSEENIAEQEGTKNLDSEGSSSSYSSGMYKIGTDMPAGEYLITATSDFAYMQVASDSSGELDSIITNDNFSNRIYITVAEGQYLQFDGTAVLASDAPAYEPTGGVYGDGVYLVGKDIPAGEYKVSVSDDALTGMGYIELASDSSGEIGSIITNNNIQTDAYQTIQDGQYLKLVGAKITIE